MVLALLCLVLFDFFGPVNAQSQLPPPRVNQKDGSVLVFVPGGEYTLGAEDLEELGWDKDWAAWAKPVHTVRLSPFWIGKYEVTNEQYARFLRDNPNHPKPYFWEHRRFNPPQHPVVVESWHDAVAYCQWAGLQLPSEAQWEAAARGTDRRRYPWGNEKLTPQHANYNEKEGGTTPVGAYPKGAGPFGTLDQAGNVWEWCADQWDSRAYWRRDGKLDPVLAPKGEAEVLVRRGGSWANSTRNLAAAFRGGYQTGLRRPRVGFRCVGLSVPSTVP